MRAGVFSITGPGGRVYISQGFDVERRLVAHYVALQNDVHPCGELQADWNAYPRFRFQFTVLGYSCPHTRDRFILEQAFLEKQKRELYNTAKLAIRDCAYYTKEQVTLALEAMDVCGKVVLIRPMDWIFDLYETPWGWNYRDALKRDYNWYLGVIQDSQKWERFRKGMCDKIDVWAYQPTEEFKRLGKSKETTKPTVRYAFSPYIFVNFPNGAFDICKLRDNFIPLSMCYAGEPIPVPMTFIEKVQQQEDVGEFISTATNRERAIKHYEIKNLIAGARLLRTDAERAVLFKNDVEFSITLRDLKEFYQAA